MVQVRVSEGVLEGEIVENSYLGGTYCSFKGIPYAQPPLGDLRFKAPQPPKAWDGVRSAKEHGPTCYQFDYFVKHTLGGSENCLYLNVYTPSIKPDKPLPVMFWIHGGAFMCGDGNDDLYGPEFLVKQDVILVTINYRLEALGFLCLDTEDIPGNAGMKDQVAALRWVKKNITNFGGDPENITIFGESAGAASVTFHLVSPMTKGLFKRAIAQSGTAKCSWANSFEPRERAVAIAKKLGFNSQNDKELYEFFKSQPVESLVSVFVPITYTEKGKEALEMQLSIVSEKQFGNNERFFYGDIDDVLRSGIHEGVEVIAGYCADEGLLSLMGNIEEKFSQANNFLETFVPKPIALNCSIKEQLQVGRRLKKFYFGDENVSMENLMQLSKFYGAEMFSIAAIIWQKHCIHKNTVYLYKFTCKSERNVMSKLFGLGAITGKKAVVCHADDLPYIFPAAISGLKFVKSSDAFKMIDNVTKLWTNFAKFGNPTPDNSLGVKWLPYTKEGEDYLDIGEILQPGTKPDKDEYEFWEKIYKEYLPHYVKSKL